MALGDAFDKHWRKETPDRLINHGDPDSVTQCPECGCMYRNGMRVEKPVKSYLRIVIENWRRYGWRIDVDYAGTHPIGYGISWQVPNRCAFVLHPVPFNSVMRTLRELVHWIEMGGWHQYPTVQDRIDHEVARRMQVKEGKRWP